MLGVVGMFGFKDVMLFGCCKVYIVGEFVFCVGVFGIGKLCSFVLMIFFVEYFLLLLRCG